MSNKHLKTLTVPKSWPIKRKGQKFIVKPNPGKSYSYSLPLALIFKDILKYCKTTKEVKSILMDKEVFVDGKRRFNHKYSVGFMDVLSVPVSNEYYRMIINKNHKLQLIEINKKESDSKICKIIGKTILKKGLIQLNLFDGRSVVVKKDNYKVGESLVLELPSQKIKGHIKLEKDSYVFLTEGKHTGEHGLVTKIAEHSIIVKTKDSEFDTFKESIYVLGKEKPLIKIEK